MLPEESISNNTLNNVSMSLSLKSFSVGGQKDKVCVKNLYFSFSSFIDTPQDEFPHNF